MGQTTPAAVLKYIQESYHSYYDSAFWLRDEKLMEERARLLRERGLVQSDVRVKVLARGDIGKALTVKAHKFSGKAAEKIAAAGGKAEVLG